MLKTISRRLALLFCSLLLDGVIQNPFRLVASAQSSPYAAKTMFHVSAVLTAA